MATINASEIRTEGSTIYIKADPAIGVLALTSFTDDSTGETPPTIEFEKTFRYSLNGITYSDWKLLTIPNITAIPVSATDTLVIEFAYKKVPYNTMTLDISSVTIDANITVPEDGEYFKNSIFSEFFGSNDINVLKWYISVLEKLYERGLIPSFISRQNDSGLPDDFIDFWKSIAKFFAYLVIYARTYQKFYDSEVLLSEYLEERGMKTSIRNDLDDLNYLMVNFYKEIFNRGTISIIDKVENGAEIDGEILRLIYYNKNKDEFLFNLYKKEHFGWNLGNSSPLYKGLYVNDNVNKAYETGMEVEDLTKYPITENVTKITDGDHSVIHIDGDVSGISSAGSLKYIKVDPRLDYEISFLIKKEAGETLNFGVTAYNYDKEVINLLSAVDGSDANFFLEEATLVRDDKYVLVRGFIYNSSVSEHLPVAETHLNQGINLVFNHDTVWIIPHITIESGTANIYGLRILPIQTSYSRGFVQTSNFISTWLTNKNSKININQVRDYIVRYLIPYNSHLMVTNIGEYLYNPDVSNVENYWLPDGEYCERTLWIPDEPACEVKYKWIPDEETAYCEDI